MATSWKYCRSISRGSVGSNSGKNRYLYIYIILVIFFIDKTIFFVIFLLVVVSQTKVFKQFLENILANIKDDIKR